MLVFSSGQAAVVAVIAADCVGDATLDRVALLDRLGWKVAADRPRIARAWVADVVHPFDEVEAPLARPLPGGAVAVQLTVGGHPLEYVFTARGDQSVIVRAASRRIDDFETREWMTPP